MNIQLFKNKKCATKKIKLIFLTLILLTHSNLLFAQFFAPANPTRKAPLLPKAYVGAKLGANFSYLSGRNWNNGVKSNILGGGFAGTKGPGFGIQAEALFEQSDFTTGENFYSLYNSYYKNIGDSLKQGSFRVNKLCLPVMLQFRMARLLWIQTGVQFYGIINVKDNASLLQDAKQIFRNGSTAGIIGSAIHLGNADIGARVIFDLQNLNNLNSGDVWRQYMFQAHIGIKLF